MGNGVYAIVFTNTGTTACSLEGWPKLTILGPRKLAAVPVHYGTGTNMWVIAATRMRLLPGASAAANVSVGRPLNASNCGYPTWKVTPPREHQSVTLSVRPSPAPGQEPLSPLVCANTGYIVVSAVYPGHGPVIGFHPSPAPSHLRHIWSTTPPA